MDPINSFVSGTNTSASNTLTSSNGVETDFQTFLQLLTTQLRNQDPLNPADSTEFVAQLANFSAVEQQIGTNDRLDKLLGALNEDNASGLATWLGREVEAEAAAVYTGDPVNIRFGPVPQDGAHKLIVRDQQGAIVYERPLSSTDTDIVWSGELSGNAQASLGQFSFSRETVGADGTNLIQGLVFSEVTEARASADGPLLILEDGSQILMDDVIRVR